MKIWLPAVAMALLPLLGLGAVQALANAPGAPVAVIFPPRLSADEALLRVAAAGGEIIGPGGFAFVVLARADDPDFAAAAYHQGAWLVTSALGAGGCAGRPRRT